MKNFFDSEYEEDCYHDKDEKCLENTDHTTGNSYERLSRDPFNPNECHLILHEDEERMIHCQDEDNYFDDSQNEVQDLEYHEDEEEKVIKTETLQVHKQEFYGQDHGKIPEDNQNDHFQDVLMQPRIQIPSENDVQNMSDYKISRKWKEKMKNVLEEKSIHQFSAKHNRNMAKFFVRLFSKYMKLCPEDQEFSAEVRNRLQRIMEKNCISLKDLETLFGGQDCKSSRQFLAKILSKKLRQEVIKSQDVQNKEAYLLCSKVYALRCRSRHLVARLQSR